MCVQGKHNAEVGFALGCNFTGTVLYSDAESNSTEQHLEADAVCLIYKYDAAILLIVAVF